MYIECLRETPRTFYVSLYCVFSFVWHGVAIDSVSLRSVAFLLRLSVRRVEVVRLPDQCRDQVQPAPKGLEPRPF